MDAQYIIGPDGLLVSAKIAKAGDEPLQAKVKQIEFDMEQVRLRAEEQKRKAAERAAVAREA